MNEQNQKPSEFMLLFRNWSLTNGYSTTSKEMEEDLLLWQPWIGRIAIEQKLVLTAPIAYEGSIVTCEGVISGKPYQEANHVLVSGFLICRADSLEEVEEWSRTCPILKYPNSSVEIRRLIPFSP